MYLEENIVFQQEKDSIKISTYNFKNNLLAFIQKNNNKNNGK